MPKRVVKTSKKEIPNSQKNYSDKKIEKILVENFVSLQKVITNLSVDFKNLSSQLSKLLELFEMSAKTLAEKELDLEKAKANKKMIEKLDSLLDQNKLIARGLALMHDRMSEEPEYLPEETQMPPRQMIQPKKIMPRQPLPMQEKPKMMMPPQGIKQPQTMTTPTNKMEGYRKSISSIEQKIPEAPSPQKQIEQEETNKI